MMMMLMTIDCNGLLSAKVVTPRLVMGSTVSTLMMTTMEMKIMRIMAMKMMTMQMMPKKS